MMVLLFAVVDVLTDVCVLCVVCICLVMFILCVRILYCCSASNLDQYVTDHCRDIDRLSVSYTNQNRVVFFNSIHPGTQQHAHTSQHAWHRIASFKHVRVWIK